MLRMYICCDCQKKHVADDGYFQRGNCPYGCENEFYEPMIKNSDGDWYSSTEEPGRSKMEVKPPLLWH